MRCKILLLFFLLGLEQAGYAQCPTGKSLWDAVEISRNDMKKSIRELLTEMLQLNRLAEKCNTISDSG